MKELVNNFDTEICFSNLEEAKKYYYPNKVNDRDTTDPENFIGDSKDFNDFLRDWDEYKSEIADSETLEELAEALNRFTDIFGDGRHYTVKHF